MLTLAEKSVPALQNSYETTSELGRAWCSFNQFAMLAVRIFDKRLEFVRLPKRFSKAFRRSQAGSLASVQPLHVIAYAFFERKLRLITKRAARARDIGLGEILVMRVRIVEVFGLKVCSETFV